MSSNGDDASDAARGDFVANVNAAAFEARAKEYQAAFRSFLDAHYKAEVAQLQRALCSSSRSFSSGGMMTTTTMHAVAMATTQQQTASDAQQQSFAFSLRICAQVLLDFNPSLGTLLFRHPDQFLPLFHAALAQEVTSAAAALTAPASTTAPRLYQDDGRGSAAVPLKVQQKLKVRIEFLPPVNPLRKITISTIRSNDVKQLIQIAGTVVRTGMVTCCVE